MVSCITCLLFYVHINTHVYAHVGISNSDLKNEKQFAEVVVELQAWFKHHMRDKAGVLVSHNTPVDVQFLLCEYIRAGQQLPPQMKYGLDTLQTLNRFSTLAYRKVPADEWPPDFITKTGKTSMGVKPCAIYALSKRSTPESFEVACGQHHDADADTRAVAVILFDELLFGQKSLQYTVFKSNKRCFQPLQEVLEAMTIKMEEPVLQFEQLPAGWVSADVSS